MINFLQRVEAKAPTPVEDAAFESREEEGAAFSDASSRSEWSIDLEKALSQLSERESDIINALVMEGRVANEVAAEKSLDKALSQLSERESDIINALVMEGRVANEVAAEKSLDVSNVYRIRRKALSKLKAWLGIEGSQAASKA